MNQNRDQIFERSTIVVYGMKLRLMPGYQNMSCHNKGNTMPLNEDS